MKKEKLIIVVMILVILLSLAGTAYIIFSHHGKENNTIKDNNILSDDSLFATVTVGDLTISDGYIMYNDEISSFGAIAKNNKGEAIKVNNLYLVMELDGEEIKVLLINDRTIEANGEIPLIAYFDSDMRKVSKVTYEID